MKQAISLILIFQELHFLFAMYLDYGVIVIKNICWMSSNYNGIIILNVFKQQVMLVVQLLVLTVWKGK